MKNGEEIKEEKDLECPIKEHIDNLLDLIEEVVVLLKKEEQSQHLDK